MSRRQEQPQRIGRYLLLEPFASGGMATVHFGRQLGAAGIGRVVAIKRLHPHLVHQAEFATMFLDEARMAMRIRHPNVAPVLDVIAERGELLIVMEYVAGPPLSRFTAKHGHAPQTLPPRIVSAIVSDVLAGLHAAHQARSAAGEPLGLVHRDVSPQNVLLGGDGVGRIIDFGVAKAAGRLQETRQGDLKGKLAYMAPEQIAGRPVSARSDVYSTAVLLWECLTGRRLLPGQEEAAVEQVLLGDFDPPSRWARDLAPEVDDVVMKGLAREPEQRWQTARDMATALEAALPRASAFEVAAWIEEHAGDELASRAARVREVETMPLHAPRSRRALWLGALAAGVLLAAGVVAWTRVHATHESPAAVATDLAAATLPSAAPALEPVQPGPPPPVASQNASENEDASAASASASRPAPHRAPARTKKSDACKVPYVIDADGHKRYNRECL